MRRCALAIAISLLALPLGGCGWCRAHRACQPPTCETDTNLPCAPTARRPFEVDLEFGEMPAPREFGYCNMNECETGCLAARQSSAAKLFEQEADAVAAQTPRHGTNSELAVRVLRLQAVHERNRAAAAARVLLLRLAEAEAATDNLQRRIEVFEKLEQRIERLRKEGIDAPLTLAEIDTSRLEIEAKQAELRGTIESLNQQLLKVLNVQLCEAHIWPDVELRIDARPIDRCAAYNEAIAQRADLAASKALAESKDRGAMAVIRAALSRYNSGLGSSSTASPLRQMFDPAGASAEASVRQGQIRESTSQQEKNLWHDIVEAAAKMEANAASAAATRDRLAAMAHTAKRLETKRESDASVAFEQSKHELAHIAAEQDLLHTVIEWKVEAVKLAEIQGALAIECGYTFGSPCPRH